MATFVHNALYLLGSIFITAGALFLIMSLFSSGGNTNMLVPFFAILNGFIAIAVGEILRTLKENRI
ncbi:hypothetical protein [Jeotgalibacillus aurantiacus]|uniref:hypothetical protein n=1 Tax=Jeotgalibacillus aurantiacus TaxID=2763266 RepID=UPI001D0B0D1D|nr:hypothetical protein [Jeotgalibacillus aurantiacus]